MLRCLCVSIRKNMRKSLFFSLSTCMCACVWMCALCVHQAVKRESWAERARQTGVDQLTVTAFVTFPSPLLCQYSNYHHIRNHTHIAHAHTHTHTHTHAHTHSPSPSLTQRTSTQRLNQGLVSLCLVCTQCRSFPLLSLSRMCVRLKHYTHTHTHTHTHPPDPSSRPHQTRPLRPSGSRGGRRPSESPLHRPPPPRRPLLRRRGGRRRRREAQ